MQLLLCKSHTKLGFDKIQDVVVNEKSSIIRVWIWIRRQNTSKTKEKGKSVAVLRRTLSPHHLLLHLALTYWSKCHRHVLYHLVERHCIIINNPHTTIMCCSKSKTVCWLAFYRHLVLWTGGHEHSLGAADLLGELREAQSRVWKMLRY